MDKKTGITKKKKKNEENCENNELNIVYRVRSTGSRTLRI